MEGTVIRKFLEQFTEVFDGHDNITACGSAETKKLIDCAYNINSDLDYGDLDNIIRLRDKILAGRWAY